MGPLRQILVPTGMIIKPLRNSGKPRKRPWVGGCRLWEAPVQDCCHVCCGVEFSTGGRCVQVEEWMLTGLGRQGGRCARSEGHDDSLVRWGTTWSARASSI